MNENRFHNVDEAVTRAVRTRLLADGITAYPVDCDYCDGVGMVEIDNNGPIGPCPICDGAKQYMVSV